MLFNSLSFLIFFPIVVLLYFVIPKKVRYLWLLLASYYFYMSWNPKYSLLMLTSTIITYLSGLLIDGLRRRKESKNKQKLCVGISFFLNISILFFFKYYDFVLASMADFLTTFSIELQVPTFDVLLPVGISFYTFQALSYTMDIYRKEIPAEKNFFRYALFVSFFPQLVAGPIERSKNLLTQLKTPQKLSATRLKRGLTLMVWGFFLKLVIADRAAFFVNTVYGDDFMTYSGLQVIIATVLFGLQIYCDFASYSEIARGSAEILGISLMENFKQPYFATSVQDFWHRWHISLSSWFRDYLYIPLGGSRVPRLRKYGNLMIVFLVSGLWHGANWTFVAWGFLHGFYQVVGNITKKFRTEIKDRLKIKDESFFIKLCRRIFIFTLVHYGWLFFRADDLNMAFSLTEKIFSTPWTLEGTLNLGLNSQNALLLLFAVAVLIIVDGLRYKKVNVQGRLWSMPIVFPLLFLVGVIFFIIIFGVYGPGYDAAQFIYFQF